MSTRESLLERYARSVGARDYRSLHEWSVADLDRFWRSVTDFVGVRWETEPTAALAEVSMPSRSWFPGGTLNWSELALARADVAPHEIAVVERGQTRESRTYTWVELREAVLACAAGLADLGVAPGVRVGAYMPNTSETLIAFLAVAYLGGVWSSCAPEFGVTAVVDRLSQFEPEVLVHIDGYRYGTKVIDRREDAAAIKAALPSVRASISVAYLGSGADEWALLFSSNAPTPVAAYVAYDHPLYVLYSSGTTGLPKPIVHSHVGITVEHLKVHRLHHDLGPGERFFWFSTTGWMMWNYLVSGLLSGASIVLFDGDPGYPNLSTLWDVAAETETTVFGVSAPFIMNCRKSELRPATGRIRQIGSTGAPLATEGFDYLAEHFGSSVLINSISGGTDICTAFLGMNDLTPVVHGEISGSLLGCDVLAVRPNGERCDVGETGELVVTTPMPSMPLGFLGDADGIRYHNAYFATFPGWWHHGDWITFSESGGCVVSGRSDATLNRGGVRLGTADFYTVVEGFDEVVDSLVIHHTVGDLDELILFVRLREGDVLGDDLITRIKQRLRMQLSPRHLPDSVVAIPEVPRTLSGKKLEVPVKKILAGADPDSALSRESLANPAAIDWFVAWAASR